MTAASIAVLTLLCISFTAPLAAQTLRERFASRMEERLSEPPAVGATEMTYGSHALHTLDFWRAPQPNAPLVVFVHGGGWKRGDKRNATGAAKVQHMLAQGYAFASLNYRLVPEARVEDQAADVASATSYLRSNAEKLGIDPTRIVLMGHSAGAHLVALVGTDERYFTAARLTPSDVKGIIALDGAAYDVAAQMRDGRRLMAETYGQAFGTDTARQRALSPTLHAAAPNAPAFLILHVDRDDGRAQSNALAKALNTAGTPATVQGFDGKRLRGHMEINRSLGDPDYPATKVVDDWLQARFGG